MNNYNEEIENAVIGAILIDPNSYDYISGKISPQSFYFNQNREIYECICKVVADGLKVDFLTIYNCAKESGKQITPAILAQKTSGIISAVHIEEHADLILELEQKRKLATACDVAMAILHSSSDDNKIDTITQSLSNAIDEVLQAMTKESTVHTFRDAILASRDELYQRIQNYREGISSIGITTGLTQLDYLIGGFRNGELVILAGRPSMGKTAVMLHFALSAARQNKNVLIFSLEMDNRSLANRAILANTYIPSGRFNEGSLTQYDIDELESSLASIASLPITIDDTSIQSVAKMESVAKLAKRKGKCDLILIDYLGLIDSPRKGGTREQEVAEISKKMKSLARKLEVPVVLLSQLSRECEKRADKMPILADLRESGAIEQDADKVIFVFRPSYYQMKNSAGELIPNDCGELIVAKNRNGKIGSVKFKHNESITRIEDYE